LSMTSLKRQQGAVLYTIPRWRGNQRGQQKESFLLMLSAELAQLSNGYQTCNKSWGGENKK